ncbi:MAG TPA: SprB repeat-containing protein [Ohtaekwangia sp.]|nr:SprB repeat-containing protein [Ohtaekwangia sp.]
MQFRIGLLSLMGIWFCFSCGQEDVDKKAQCENSTLSVALREITSSTGCGTNDGLIGINVHGGKEPYMYYLNDEISSGPDFTNLLSGIYKIRVRDKAGCERVLDNITVMAEGFSFSAEVQENTMCTGSGNGAITITVSEGVSPYLFKLGNGSFTESNIFQSLRHGTYDVLLKDGADCTVALNVTIPKGPTHTSWLNDIKPLITTYCALSGCHNGISRPDLRIYAKAKEHASKIKSLTKDRSMPFEGKLTQEQINLFGCWVDDGALEN